MTSLLPAAARVRDDLRRRRPLAPVAAAGGAAAALATLLLCLAVAVVGWFLTDAGAHGEPRDALRVGALGWLLGHGSGVSVEGARVTAVPLGISLLCAGATWKLGTRVGDAVSGHGPDADAIADGERDWTVPVATGLFAGGYAVVAVLAWAFASTPTTSPSAGRVLLWTLLLCAIVAGPAVAVGSGRAAIWAAVLPDVVRGAAATCRQLLVGWVTVCATVLVVAFLLDLDTALNVLSELGTDASDTAVLTLLTALLLPNAVAFTGSYLLGPGFTVGVGTLVTPSAVALGPLPVFPLLAALPDHGTPAAWTAWLVALPVLVAAWAAARVERRAPSGRWSDAAVRGLAGGAAAGVVVGLVAAVAGGAVGPGRMTDVGPFAAATLGHAVTAFAVGGVLGGLLAAWWQRRAS